MKFAHLIRLRVYIKEEDIEEKVISSFLSFFPFDIEKERLAITRTSAEGFEHKKIRVIELTIIKEKYTSQFLNSLISRLDEKQKEQLLKEAESRLDSKLNLFLRFDKGKLISENKLWLTDSGNCFHIKISIAAFPAKRDKAMDVIKGLL